MGAHIETAAIYIWFALTLSLFWERFLCCLCKNFVWSGGGGGLGGGRVFTILTKSILKKDNCRRLQSSGFFKEKNGSFQSSNFMLSFFIYFG